MFGGKGLGYGGNASVLALAWSGDGGTCVTLDVKLCGVLIFVFPTLSFCGGLAQYEVVWLMWIHCPNYVSIISYWQFKCGGQELGKYGAFLGSLS